MDNVNPNTASDSLARWLTIVGIGENGLEGLSARARSSIESAAIVFGGRRHLELAASLIRGETRAWRTPFDASVAEILECRGKQVCVLASGDPFQHGVGATLARHVAANEVTAIPVASAFSLAASRMLWSLPDVALVSFCGHPFDSIRPHLYDHARILALTSGANDPAVLAKLLCAVGFSRSRLTVLEALGGLRERVRSARADEFALDDIADLNTVAIEVIADPGACGIPLAVGLADELFENDGQITKREIRALTLSALAPQLGDHLWDVGAGSGSVSIEWLLCHKSLSATSIEQRVDRADRVRRNACKFGVSTLKVLNGPAPAVLAGLRAPNAIFIGGGANAPGLVETAIEALLPRGRLVINAVTLDTEALLTKLHGEHGGRLMRVEVQHAAPIGGEQSKMIGWKPTRPITQWSWIKP